MPAPDLTAAATVVGACKTVVDNAVRHLATTGTAAGLRADAIVDANQQVAYDLAHAASAVENARAVLDYGNKGDLEGRLSCAFVADAAFDVVTRLLSREDEWGVAPGALDSVMGFVRQFRSAAKRRGQIVIANAAAQIGWCRFRVQLNRLIDGIDRKSVV